MPLNPDPPAPEPSPEPVDIAEFGRLTSTPEPEPEPAPEPDAEPDAEPARFRMAPPVDATPYSAFPDVEDEDDPPPSIPDNQLTLPPFAGVPEPPPTPPAQPGLLPVPPSPSGRVVAPAFPPVPESLPETPPAPSFQPPPAPAPAVEAPAWPPPRPDSRAAPPAVTGPVGRRRSPAAVVALAVVTLGLYVLIWHDKVNREMSDFHFGLDVRPRRSTAAVAVAWLIALLVTAGGVARLVLSATRVSPPFDPVISTDVAWLLTPAVLLFSTLVVLLPFSLVATVMTLERLRLAESHSGLPTDEQVHPSSLVWVLLVPLIGGLILIGRAQGRLNATWLRAGSRAAAAGWGLGYDG